MVQLFCIVLVVVVATPSGLVTSSPDSSVHPQGPASRCSQTASRAAAPTGFDHISIGVSSVVICGHLNRWAVVCSSVLHRGQRAVGYEWGSILCLYAIRRGDLDRKSVV